MRQKMAVKRVTTDLANSVLTGDCFEQRLFSVGRAILVFAFVGALQACAAPERLSAVPKGQLSDASVPGVPEARLHYDVDAEPFERLGLESVRREKAYLEEQGQAGALPPAHFLVISGGGDNGAFGAGLLVGWTKAGDRPEFKLVTGISTGALIAPFAFLGPEYDAKLKEVYTTISADDVFLERGVVGGFFGDALAATCRVEYRRDCGERRSEGAGAVPQSSRGVGFDSRCVPACDGRCGGRRNTLSRDAC
jgi:hypothetical protein